MKRTMQIPASNNKPKIDITLSLLMAVKQQKTSYIEHFLKTNTEIKKEILNHPFEDGFTLLHYACAFGWTTIVSQLLCHDADRQCLNNFKNTPIMCAIISINDILQNTKRLQWDLKDKRPHCEAYSSSNEGGTLYAIKDQLEIDGFLKYLKIINLILAKNFNDTITMEDKNIISLLCMLGTRYFCPELYLTAAARLDALSELLINYDINTNFNLSPFDTSAFDVFLKSNEYLARRLYQKGANFNFKMDPGETILHAAILSPIALKILLEGENKKFIEQVNDAGETPLYYAIKYNIENSIEILFQHGAKVNTGYDPIYLNLGNYKNLNLVKALLTYDKFNFEAQLADYFNEAISKQSYDIAVFLLMYGIFKNKADSMLADRGQDFKEKHFLNKFIREQLELPALFLPITHEQLNKYPAFFKAEDISTDIETLLAYDFKQLKLKKTKATNRTTENYYVMLERKSSASSNLCKTIYINIYMLPLLLEGYPKHQAHIKQICKKSYKALAREKTQQQQSKDLQRLRFMQNHPGLLPQFFKAQKLEDNFADVKIYCVENVKQTGFCK